MSFTEPGATDANGDAVHYTSMIVGSPDTALPSWLHFNAASLTWSGTPPAAGTWQVVYWAIDSHNVATSKVFTLTVKTPVGPPPTYNGGIPATVNLDFDPSTDNTYTFPASAFSSPSGYALTYTATANGVALPTDGVTLDSATRTFTAGYRRPSSTLTIVLTATDSHGQKVSHTFTLVITGGVGTKAVPAGGIETDAMSTGTTTDVTTATTDATAATTTGPNIQAYWFTYDADNRVEVSGGELVDGQIQIVDRTGSQSQAYDAAGDVVATLTTDGTATLTQTSSYDVRGGLIADTLADGDTETRRYDADGRVTVVDTYYAPGTTLYVDPPNDDGPPNSPMNIGGWLESATITTYDADGHVKTSTNYGRQHEDWDADWPTRLTSGAGQADPGSTGYGLLTEHSQVNYGSAGYDGEGHALGYSYAVENSYNQWYTTTYTVKYLKKDGYLEASTTGTSTDPTVLATTDTSVYDAYGRRIAIDTNSEGQTTDPVRTFAYDANGQILERRDGSATDGSTFTVATNGGYALHHYAYVNGQQIGEVDEAGGIDVLSGVTGFSNSASGTQDYVVQAGDTLAGIAQQVYGDASLWYVVANANGLQSDDDLVAGQTLKLPQVTTSSNTSQTFKPYDPSAIQGGTTPTLAQAPQPPPSAQHCSALAEIVVIAVVVVVSIYTAGAASEAFAGTLGTAAGGGASGVMAAGVTAMSGGAGLAGVGAAAIGGAVGDAAGQLVGDAEGVHQGFSWGEVAGAGIGAGITAGLSGAITDGQSIQSLAKADTWTDDAKIAAVGASGAIGDYAGNKLVGQPASFSWANMAAAALSTEITAKVGLPTNRQLSAGESSGHFLEDLGGGLVNGAIDSETARLLGGDAQNGRQIFEDAFGNALGNAAVGAINEAEWKAAQPSINKQINTAISNIWGDDSTSTASSNAVALGYQAYAVNADPALSAAAGLASSDAIGGLSAPAGADQGAGFPIMWQGDPSNPADVAALQAEMQHFQAYLTSANGQSLVPGYPLPPTAGDFQAQLAYGKTAAEAISAARNFADASVNDTVTPQSAMQQDVAAANAAQADTETALSSLQGSVGGDLLYGALTLGTRGLLDLGVAAESVADIATDRLSAEQAVTGFGNMLWNVGSAAVHPVNTYNHWVNGMTNWFEESPDQQAQDIGRLGIDTLVFGGVEGIAAKGLGYIDTLADGFGGEAAPNIASQVFDPATVKGPFSLLNREYRPVTYEQFVQHVTDAGLEDAFYRPLSEVYSDVYAVPKGLRPDPATYLSPDYIDSHLSQFSDGVTKFTSTVPTGIVGPAGGTFAMPTSLADELIGQSGGSVAQLEELLGLDPGTLGVDPVRIDISPPDGLCMSSGRERGANPKWLPGGYTRGGIPEATINQAAPGTYVVEPVFH